MKYENSRTRQIFKFGTGKQSERKSCLLKDFPGSASLQIILTKLSQLQFSTGKNWVVRGILHTGPQKKRGRRGPWPPDFFAKYATKQFVINAFNSL